MKRCMGGIRGGIGTYTPEKSFYKSVGWIYAIGGLPLRQPPKKVVVKQRVTPAKRVVSHILYNMDRSVVVGRH